MGVHVLPNNSPGQSFCWFSFPFFSFATSRLWWSPIFFLLEPTLIHPSRSRIAPLSIIFTELVLDSTDFLNLSSSQSPKLPLFPRSPLCSLANASTSIPQRYFLACVINFLFSVFFATCPLPSYLSISGPVRSPDFFFFFPQFRFNLLGILRSP